VAQVCVCALVQVFAICLLLLFYAITAYSPYFLYRSGFSDALAMALKGFLRKTARCVLAFVIVIVYTINVYTSGGPH